MGPSFNEQFEQHDAWRRDFARRLRHLSEWLSSHDLMDDSVRERMQRLETQVRTDKIMVAFVAEFSRGKSELINAVFFAGYGRRIMPASAGRTTMCPTELGYDAALPSSLRLLPIETRLSAQGLSDWRSVPERWLEVPLDVDDGAQIAEAIAKVAEVRTVSVDEARSLGFWHDELPQENPHKNADGLVEVPRWRHALINLPHPLLQHGLVILDTPGLNAIGAEPELTVNLIPQAHAVVFILAADAGVTRSDLAIWREHLAETAENAEARLVVLNKIDTLWDTLSSAEQVEAQLQRQRKSSADTLGIAPEQVLLVSAQKGLVAKISCNDVMLESSGLPKLEDALAQGIMGQRQSILRSAIGVALEGVRSETGRLLNIRRRDLDDQMVELGSLRGKNAAVIEAMRQRIEMEREEFGQCAAKIQAVRSVHLKLLRDILESLSAKALKGLLAGLAQGLRQKGLKLGVKKQYADTFDRLRSVLDVAQANATEIQAMLAGTFRQLNAEFGFSLQIPQPIQLDQFVLDLVRIERSHVQYLSVGNVLKLVQPEFAERLVRALSSRLRAVFESAANDLELWSNATMAQLDAQLRERRRSFSRRIDAVDRIQAAASGLEDRITEIEESEQTLDSLSERMEEFMRSLLSLSSLSEPELQESPDSPSLRLATEA